MKRTILIVDDEEDIRSSLTLSMGRLGYRVLSANSGKEAVRLLETAKVDLVVTDIIMPQMDGFEILRYLKETQIKIPVIVISGGGERLEPTELLETADLLGGARTLAKPFSVDKLADLCSELLK